MRCLKRYVARELFPFIQAIVAPPDKKGAAEMAA
jgi:hypothetical protein